MDPFRSLDINPKTIAALHKANINSFKHVLKLSLPELVLYVKRPESELIHLIETISRDTVNSKIIRTSLLYCPENALRHRLSISCPKLDELLNGGILIKTVTEITGESGTGKTQFCMQLSIRAQLPIKEGGFNSDVAYICTEDAFPIKRLNQMISMFVAENPVYKSHNFTDSIHVSHVSNLSHLLLCLRRDIPSLLKSKNTKLVVIDSVAAIIRGGYDRKDFGQRADDLFTLGFEIWRLANENEICVVCVNQVTGDFKSGMSIPSLGLLWANVLTSRIMLHKTEDVLQCQDVIRPVRKLELVFSSYLPNVTCFYVITESGFNCL